MVPLIPSSSPEVVRTTFDRAEYQVVSHYGILAHLIIQIQ